MSEDLLINANLVVQFALFLLAQSAARQRRPGVFWGSKGTGEKEAGVLAACHHSWFGCWPFPQAHWEPEQLEQCYFIFKAGMLASGSISASFSSEPGWSDRIEVDIERNQKNKTSREYPEENILLSFLEGSGLAKSGALKRWNHEFWSKVLPLGDRFEMAKSKSRLKSGKDALRLESSSSTLKDRRPLQVQVVITFSYSAWYYVFAEEKHFYISTDEIQLLVSWPAALTELVNDPFYCLANKAARLTDSSVWSCLYWRWWIGGTGVRGRHRSLMGSPHTAQVIYEAHHGSLSRRHISDLSSQISISQA